MPVITIRGQLGSGAPEIGKLLAQHIGGDYVDREIIAEVAAQAGVPSHEVVTKEQPPGSLVGRILESLGKSAAMDPGTGAVWWPTWEAPLGDPRYLEALTTVIRDLAKSPSIVIRGRGSQFILKDHPEVFHVLVVAPREIRLKRVMEMSKLDEDGAKKELDRFDGSRREFIKRYFNAELEDPVHYDLVVNTNRISFEEATQLVLDALVITGKAKPRLAPKRRRVR